MSNNETKKTTVPEYSVKVKTYPKNGKNRYGSQIGKMVTKVKNNFAFKPSDMVDYDFKEFMDYTKWDTKEPFEKKRSNDTRTKFSFLPNTEELFSFHPVKIESNKQNGAGKKKKRVTKRNTKKGSRTRKNKSHK